MGNDCGRSCLAMDDPKKVPLPPSPAAPDEELRRLGRRFFAQARQASEQDEAEIAAWKKANRKWPEILAGQLGSLAADAGGSCDGDGGGCGGD